MRLSDFFVGMELFWINGQRQTLASPRLPRTKEGVYLARTLFVTRLDFKASKVIQKNVKTTED